MGCDVEKMKGGNGGDAVNGEGSLLPLWASRHQLQPQETFDDDERHLPGFKLPARFKRDKRIQTRALKTERTGVAQLMSGHSGAIPTISALGVPGWIRMSLVNLAQRVEPGVGSHGS